MGPENLENINNFEGWGLTLYAFLSNTFTSNVRLKLGKDQTNAKQHPEAELLLFENYLLSSSTLSEVIGNILKSKYVCLNKVIWIMTMKMRLKMKNRSHRFDINRPRPRHGHKYTKNKIGLSIVIVICIKQHLSNIWSSIHEEVKQRWSWVEKSVAYKKACSSLYKKSLSEN